MNPIEAFRMSQQSKQKDDSVDEISTSGEDENKETSQQKIKDKRAQYAATKKREYGPGDLRQKSLAMYKSINSMLTLANKKDQVSIKHFAASAAEGILLDCGVQVLQRGGALTQQDFVIIRQITDELLQPHSLKAALLPSEVPKSNSESSLLNSSITTNLHLTSLELVDAVKLREWMKKELDAFEKIKKEKVKISGVNEKLKLDSYVEAVQGHRKVMEDYFVMVTHLNELVGLNDFEEQSFFGVYDGHSGKAAAKYTRQHLHLNICRDEHFRTDLVSAILNGYKQTDEEFNQIARRESTSAGTTAVTALIRQDSIWIANVGDSEAVLCKDGIATVLSTSHLPNKEEEKERIHNAGGTVVWYGTWRVNGLLSVSRSIGDLSLKDLLIPVPTILEVKRTVDDEFLILATDGLWDVITYQDACDFVKEQLKHGAERAAVCQALIDDALEKKSGDNTSALIVFFNQ